MADTHQALTAEVTVPAEPQDAFTAFTARMGEWWDPLLTADPQTFSGIAIDPDGPVEMLYGDQRATWGRVTAWEPFERFAMAFWLGQDPASPTDLSVTFTEVAGGTRVHLTHGGWSQQNAADRERYSHWDDLLRRYSAALVD